MPAPTSTSENTAAAPANRNGQAARPLEITFLNDKALDGLFTVLELKGYEGICELSRFELHLVAENTKSVPFDQLMGQLAAVALTRQDGTRRYFTGIINLLSRRQRDRTHTHYRAELVPPVWVLTKQFRSRVFQDNSMTDIVEKVLQGAPLPIRHDVDVFERKPEYRVQYRESDFDFLSRLLEEEGAHYYFRPSAEKAGDYVMTISLDPRLFGDLQEVDGDGVQDEANTGSRQKERVLTWETIREIRSGKTTLWDHSFELPDKHLEAEKTIQSSVSAGPAGYRLDTPFGKDLEIYEYPGGYAHRYDGIDKGGGEQPTELRKLFEANQRAATLRMQQEAVNSLRIHGTSTCPQFMSGHRFTLMVPDPLKPGKRKSDGQYLLTRVWHHATQPLDRSGKGEAFRYSNEFECIPAGLAYPPPRRTPKPVIPGTQTAVVVGPKGEEVYTDKFGRVKVQFFWDREGKHDLDSSCWVRVAQGWAGKRWGIHFWPRVGHEVVVAFEEGDPDKPLIIGCVYNAENMPPYEMPKHQTQSGIKTHSTPKGTDQNFNELRFEDKKGHEEIYLHAEQTLNTVVEGCEGRAVGGMRTTTIHKGERLTVDEDGRETVIKKGPEILTVEDGKRETTIAHGETLTVKDGGRQTVIQKGIEDLIVNEGDRLTTVTQGNDELRVSFGNALRQVNNGDYTVTAKTIHLKATDSISIEVGSSFITISQDLIMIQSKWLELTGTSLVKLLGGQHVQVKSQMIDLN